MSAEPTGGDGGDWPQLQEERVKSTTVLQGHFLHARRDEVRLPDGAIATREYIVHPGAVMIVPILDDGRLVLERQYRYPVGRVFVEFPAGKIDPGEPVWDCGRRELEEETGYRAREWARAGVIHNAIAYSTEGIEIWFARGLQAGASRLDAGEFLDVFTATAEEMDAWVASGRLTDVKTIFGLMWLQKWRAGAWKLDWQPSPDA